MSKHKINHIKQHDETDCGAACIAMICRYYGKDITIPSVRKIISTDKQGSNIYGIVTGVTKLGLIADGLEGNFDELKDSISKKEIGFPFIARILNKYNYEHYIVIYSFENNTFKISDPGEDKITYLSTEEFKSQWLGNIITFEKSPEFDKISHKSNKINFIKHLLKQKKPMLAVLIIALIVTGINVFKSYIFKYIVDELTVKAENIIFSDILTISLIGIAAFIISYFISIAKDKILAKSIYHINTDITNEFCDYFFKVNPAELINYNSGDLISRFYELDTIRNLISTMVISVVFSALTMLFSSVFLISISPYLFIETILLALSYILIIFIYKKPLKEMNKLAKEKQALTTSAIKESIQGLNTVKQYNSEDFIKNKVKKAHNELFETIRQATIVNSKQNTLISTIYAVNTILFLLLGTILFIYNIISVGSLIAYYSMIGFFMEPLSQLSSMQSEIQSAKISSDRLNDIIELEQDKDSGEIFYGLDEAISIENIDFRYGARELVLENLSLKIKAGQKIALIGESGCGKTTVARLLTGDYCPENGIIKFDDNDLQSLNKTSIRNKIAYIEQETILINDSIRNNITMGRDIPDENIEKAIKICALDRFIDSLPNKIDTVINENGKNLSGGQRQRISIARALVNNPDILIMDEATSNLDNITENAIMDAINNLPASTTVIIIAHRLKTIKNCDVIHIMKQGNIIASDTHENLIQHNEWYQNQWM